LDAQCKACVGHAIAGAVGAARIVIARILAAFISISFRKAKLVDRRLHFAPWRGLLEWLEAVSGSVAPGLIIVTETDLIDSGETLT
jgi:hypothetical protein